MDECRYHYHVAAPSPCWPQTRGISSDSQMPPHLHGFITTSPKTGNSLPHVCFLFCLSFYFYSVYYMTIKFYSSPIL